MQAYSTPITPPPTTISDLGSASRPRIWSLLMMVLPFTGTLSDTAGLVPTAMMIWSGLQRRIGLRAFHVHLVRIDETGNAVHHVDAVARQLRFGHVDLGLDHRLDAESQVRHGDLFLHPVVHAVDRAVVVAGEMQHRLAHGLGGDGAGVDAHAAHHLPGLDHGHALAHLGGGHGGPLARGPGTDNDQVVLYRAHAVSLPVSMHVLIGPDC